MFCPLSDRVTHLTGTGKDLCQVFFFFSFPEANKNDLLYPDKKTQNVSVGYMLFLLFGRY